MTGLLAWIVDAFIVVPVGFVVLWVIEGMFGDIGLLRYAVWFGLWVAYWEGWHSSPRGATPGEMALGIQRSRQEP